MYLWNAMYKLILHFTVLVFLAGCAGAPVFVAEDAGLPDSVWTQKSGVWTSSSVPASAKEPQSRWEHYRFPGKNQSGYTYVHVDGRDAIAAEADSSASMLRRKVQVTPERLRHVRFSWKVPALISVAELGNRELDDAPVRVVLAFDGDRSTFSAKNAMLNELTRALTGEEMPYAVLMYVWSKQKPLEAVIPSPRTDRVRKLVVETGGDKVNQWLAYERDIVSDFQKVYGELPGPLIGIGVMTDTDNTQTKAHALYGPVEVVVD